MSRGFGPRIHTERYAIERGRSAYLAGRPYALNEYDPNCLNYFDWHQGWIAGYDAEADSCG